MTTPASPGENRAPKVIETTAQRAIRWAIFNGLSIVLLLLGFWLFEIETMALWKVFIGSAAIGLAGMIVGSNLSRWRMKKP